MSSKIYVHKTEFSILSIFGTLMFVFGSWCLQIIWRLWVTIAWPLESPWNEFVWKSYAQNTNRLSLKSSWKLRQWITKCSSLDFNWIFFSSNYWSCLIYISSSQLQLIIGFVSLGKLCSEISVLKLIFLFYEFRYIYVPFWVLRHEIICRAPSRSRIAI